MLCIGLHAPAITTTSHHSPSPTPHRQRQPPRAACHGLQVAEVIRLEHRTGLLRVTATEHQIRSNPSRSKIRHRTTPQRLEHRLHRRHHSDNRLLVNLSLLHRHPTRSARATTLPPQLLPQEDLHFQPLQQLSQAQTTFRMEHKHSRHNHNRLSPRRSARIQLSHRQITFNNRSRQQ